MISRLLLFFIAVLCLTAQTVNAQTDFERWRQQQEKGFQQFKDAQDRAFLEFLKQQWKEMELLKGITPDVAPKPVRIPIYR